MYTIDDEDIRDDAFRDAVYNGREADDPEPDCECRLCGDQADASECELHGTVRRPMGRAMKIKTNYDFPAIPVRDYDWSAWIEGTEDEGMIIGRGPTEEAAITDLKISLGEVA